MIKRIAQSSLFLLLFLVLPLSAHARLGVGVGTGKILVDDQLKPGVIYELPSLNVLNTGDEAAEYAVTVTYHEEQPEKMPPESWFMFSPSQFRLEPGGVQEVRVNLNLPVRAEPGDYFGYLEAYPMTSVEAGDTQIGIAAAAKLYFTVVPGSLFEGIYYKILSFWQLYSPWTTYAAIGVGVLAAALLFKRFFNIQISTRHTHKQQGDEGEHTEQPEPTRRRSRLRR